MATALTTVKSDRQEATEFLDALFGRYFQNQEGWVELRFLPSDKTGPVEQGWSRQGKLDDEGWSQVQRRNKAKHVIVGVNPRTIQRGSAVDIESVICLWVDVDGKEEGGKESAFKRIEAFPIHPSILIDSGHGYHAYWLLQKPIVEITEEKRLEVRQTLSGLIAALKADRARTDLSSCLRLPGTMNIKPGEEPVKCTLLYSNPNITYSLSDFAAYRDSTFKVPEGSDEELPVFGERECLISDESEAKAWEGVDRLQVSTRARKMILTGKAIRLKDNTASGRDISIIDSLVWAKYGYTTIRSIFFNLQLKCSDRIRKEGEGALKYDVKRALKYCEQRAIHGTPQSHRILAIKKDLVFQGPEKLAAIKEYVTGDLLKNPEAVGEGFYEDEEGPYYFFHHEERSLIDLDSKEFELFLESRYFTDKKDAGEIILALKAAIYATKRKVEPQIVHYFDEAKGVLYLDNGMNGIYRLDGKEVQLLNNGDEGVFFKQQDRLVPFELKSETKVTNYFQGEVPEDYRSSSAPLKGLPLGLSLEKFRDSYLDQYLVSRASFAEEEQHHITPEEQKLVLIVYFYSLFFESIFSEKPIAAFIGKMASGKSFISTSIGKILFGSLFERHNLPDNDDFLKAVLADERYVIFDNVSSIKYDMQNTLCAYATGRPKMGRRGMHTMTQVRGTPRVFIVLTSCEPRSWQPDLMRRILLFNTKLIKAPIGPDELWAPVMKNRDIILTEVMENLNTIVRLINRYRGDNPENPLRIIAGWASFGQKVTSWLGERQQFRAILHKLGQEKEDSVLDEDPLWWVLEYQLFERRVDVDEEHGPLYGDEIEPRSTTELWQFLLSVAEEMKIEKEFKTRYKSPVSLGNHLAAIKEELSKKIIVDKVPRGAKHFWGFRWKAREEEESTTKPEEPVAQEPDNRWSPAGIDEPVDQVEAVKEAGWTEDDLDVLGKAMEEEEERRK